MKTVNQLVVKEIERVADTLQISKIEAAKAVKRNFEEDGLASSAKQCDNYILEYRE